MAFWLFKEEPGVFSFSDLQREGRAVWSGVKNALARQHLRKILVGDRVFFYHTGKDKAVVGVMRVVVGPKQDPSSDDAKAVVVEVEPEQSLSRPVPLARIKEDAELAGWDLVRLPRLSIVPVTEQQWQRIEELGRSES